MDKLVVSGAREHNLKDVTVAIPRDSLTVITGLSGSGKSSLALTRSTPRGSAGTSNRCRRTRVSPRADGQARRRFDRGPVAGDLDRSEDDLPQPAVDGWHGHRDLRLPPPAVGADRHPHCHVCGRPITGQSAEQIIDQVLELPEQTRFMVLAPIVRAARGSTASSSRSCEPRASAGSRSTASCGAGEEIVLDKKYKTTSPSSSTGW